MLPALPSSSALPVPLMDPGRGGTVQPTCRGVRSRPPQGRPSAFFSAAVYTTLSHTASGPWSEPFCGAGSQGNQTPFLPPGPKLTTPTPTPSPIP